MSITCPGAYEGHLQGVCADGSANVYWSFTTVLVKTGPEGGLIKKVPVADHHGDLCHHGGRIYIAVNFGKFNDPRGNADSWIYTYAADDLREIARHKVANVVYGAGGIAYREGRFFVVGGLPDGLPQNYVYEYDTEFNFVEKHTIQSGHTRLGIQTATFADERFWFGCYGNPRVLLVTDASFQLIGRYEFDCALGIENVAPGRFLVGRGNCRDDHGCVGWAIPANADDKNGLLIAGDRERNRR